MTSARVLIESSDDFSLKNYARVSWNGAGVELSQELLARLDATRDRMLRLLARIDHEQPIYGVNVGAGDKSSTRLDDTSRADYARGLNSATSFGEPFPERVVRGIVLARLSSYVEGVSGVSSALATRVASMLDEELPSVPRESNGGAGEILPLGHVFSSVPDKLSLGPKEAMALINGSPCAAALAADIGIRARCLIRLVEDVIALAIDALNSPASHFDPGLASGWGHPEEATALAALASRIAGPAERETKQARVSVRIAPRVLAQLHAAVRGLEETAETCLRHVGDNPAFIEGDDGPSRIVSNGGFHQQRAVVAIDTVTRTVCDLTQLSQHLLHALYQSPEAMPGQDNLALGIAYMAAGAWSDEARLLASPSVLSFAAVGQNDVPNPIFSAWNKADKVIRCLMSQLALLSAVASQGFALTGRRPAPALEDFLASVREVMPPIVVRRDVGPDIGRLAEAFATDVDCACAGYAEPT